MGFYKEPHFLRIYNKVKRKTFHYTPEMHEKEAMEHKRMEANTPSDQLWDAFDHLCHAEAHMILANNKRKGLSEMYNFKTNIRKRFWNVLELSEGKYDLVDDVLDEAITSRGLYVTRQWKDGSNEPKKITVTRPSEYGRDIKRKKRVGSKIKADLARVKREREAETLRNIMNSIFSPYKNNQ